MVLLETPDKKEVGNGRKDPDEEVGIGLEVKHSVPW
jgi:hypothetical protein